MTDIADNKDKIDAQPEEGSGQGQDSAAEPKTSGPAPAASSGGGADSNWMEVRVQGKLPERRSNHASFIQHSARGNYFYIHGGRDLKEGALSNMWRIDIDGVARLKDDSTAEVQWEPVDLSGNGP